MHMTCWWLPWRLSWRRRRVRPEGRAAGRQGRARWKSARSWRRGRRLSKKLDAQKLASEVIATEGIGSPWSRIAKARASPNGTRRRPT